MVGAEHQLATGLQEHLDVRLCSAAVAAVVRGQPRGFESHVHGPFVAPWRRVEGGCGRRRSEEHTSELQSRGHLVCRLLLEKKKDQFGGIETEESPDRIDSEAQ